MKGNMGENKLCPACGMPFVCAIAGPQACWCASLPPLMPMPQATPNDPVTGCYCPTCLQRLIQQKLLADADDLTSD